MTNWKYLKRKLNDCHNKFMGLISKSLKWISILALIVVAVIGFISYWDSKSIEQFLIGAIVISLTLALYSGTIVKKKEKPTGNENELMKSSKNLVTSSILLILGYLGNYGVESIETPTYFSQSYLEPFVSAIIVIGILIFVINLVYYLFELENYETLEYN